MEQTSQKQQILHDNMWKVSIRLAWPAVIAMVLYGMNTVFDAFFVGRYVGETALAGVSLAYPLTQMTLGIGSLIGVGAGSALSIAIGKNDEATQRKLLGNANYLTLITSLFFTLGALIFARQLVAFMGGEGEALEYGVAYFKVTLYGALFWSAGLAGNMIIRAEGRMKRAAVMMGSGLVVNILINYILIVLFKMGVEGAAIGTNIGMIVYTLTSFIYFARQKASFKSNPFSIRRDPEIIKSILSMGMSSLIMNVMTLIQAVLVLNALNAYGTNSDVAFYGVAYRIFTFMLTPVFGLMRALQPAVGINYGAGKYRRVIQSFYVFAVVATLLLLPFWLIMMIAPANVLHLMLPESTFLASDLMNFRLFMSLLPILPVIFMAMTFFPAINKGNVASLIGIARQVVFYIPLMLILPRFFGVFAVYVGAFGIDLIICIWTWILVFKEFKILKKTDQPRAMKKVFE